MCALEETKIIYIYIKNDNNNNNLKNKKNIENLLL